MTFSPILRNELSEWLLSEPLRMNEDHAIGYYPMASDHFGPGPVKALPNVLCNSFHVFEVATAILDAKPNRRLIMLIPLVTSEVEPQTYPETREQIEEMLNLSPPSLLVSDEQARIFADSTGIISIRETRTSLVFYGCGINTDSLSARYILFKEKVAWSLEHEYQPYILIGKDQWLPASI